ncbi:hypothetical protein QG516_00515 [Pedobacter gandavensis]|uniref:hypothetical protein n=1 Tax=Pedobacter gandavensis TaxID=2679963 RepID=UPI002479E9F3|nr:hypothetical protein [Pedobacter gandavensis]WGQ10136.1 hypothetical protein QG516_00515 [Pedobacter gandavensis]
MKIKLLLFSSLIFFLFKPVHAKNENQEKEFLNWFFRAHQKLNGKVFYLGTLDDESIKYLRSTLKPDTLYSGLSDEEDFKHFGKDKLVFSKSERMLIQKKIIALKFQNLPDQLFEGGKLLTSDSLKLYAEGNLDAWSNLNKNKIYKYFMFSRPIFLRNNTICLFNYAQYCGFKCGIGKTAIYRKEHGRWRRLMVLSSWIS